jgi:hypothetical protein
MAIPVTCPGCRTRFQVSDQHAGKSGPCPKCKTTIRVPTKEEEVKIQVPEQFVSGGRTVSGGVVFKPIARKEVKFSPMVALGIVGAFLAVLLVTWVARGLIQTSALVRALGLLAVSPALVIGAYTFLRDDELEPHRGRSLYVRAGICAVAYAILWGVYGYASAWATTDGTRELWTWVFIAPPFLIAGSLVALACLDLEFGDGFFHYSFYLLVTMLLRWTAGMGWL